jgi:hypothetical protein
MTSRFFLSLTAFSLVLGSSSYAEEAYIEEEWVAEEDGVDDVLEREAVALEEESEVRAAPKSKMAPDEAPKKVKPHYAGAKRQVEVAEDAQKKSKKVKNQWFFSKTQPKTSKKEAVKVEEREEEVAELPADRPYFKRVSHLPVSKLTADNSDTMRAPVNSRSTDSLRREEVSYPQTGFQAPKGHIYFTGEWLFWRTRQEGMEFATSKKIDFDYDSGFRVGLGAHLPYDGWDSYVNYTYFAPEESEGAHGSFYPLFLYQGAGSSGPVVAEARGHWDIRFQTVDVEFGRVYHLSKTLIFRPFIGLKGAWIDQGAHFHYEGGYIPEGQTFRTHFENEFKGAGPLVGIESNWEVGEGFCLFGNLATALVAGQFHNEQQQHQMGGSEVVHLDTVFNLVSPTLQLAAGIGWDRNFHRDMCHVGISLGFESQYWWNQNQTEKFTDDRLPTYTRQSGDLALYGLTLRGRFDF